MMARAAAITLAAVLGLGGLALAATLPLQDGDDSAAPSAAATPGADIPAAQGSEWADAPITPGDWSYLGGLPGEDSAASFTAPDGEVLAQIACIAESGDVELTFSGTVLEAEGITIRTETQSRTLAADAHEAFLAALLPGQDELLDAIAFSKGRFAVEVSEGQAYFLPAWPEITRVVEDCR